MPGYEKNAKHDWRIEIAQDGMYAEFNDTASKAYEVFNEINGLCPDSKMFCDGELVTK